MEKASSQEKIGKSTRFSSWASYSVTCNAEKPYPRFTSPLHTSLTLPSLPSACGILVPNWSIAEHESCLVHRVGVKRRIRRECLDIGYIRCGVAPSSLFAGFATVASADLNSGKN